MIRASYSTFFFGESQQRGRSQFHLLTYTVHFYYNLYVQPDSHLQGLGYWAGPIDDLPHYHHLDPRNSGPKGESTIWLSHHMTLAPHSTALNKRFFYPFPLANIPSNYHKKTQITPPQPIFRGRLVKTPTFSRFHHAGTAGQKHP